MVPLKLTAAGLVNCSTVKSKFEKLFIPCTKVIFERAKFNYRKQEANETMEVFITGLQKLSER